jgi:hypothetical protein
VKLKPGSKPRESLRMMLAVLGADGREPALHAWTVGLRRAGVPFTVVAMQDREQRSSFLSGFAEGAFQALIVADGEILDQMQGTADGEVLQAAERRFGTRRLVAYSSPTAARGLRPAGTAGPLDDVTARLTESGRHVFPYLRGEVAMDPGSWAQRALPRLGQSFEPLLVDPGGAVLLGIHRFRDGREEMVQTFAVNGHQSQAQLLRPGQIRWLTRGLHLGCERVYLPLHVDDVLLPNHAWDLTRHATDDSAAAARRMTAADGLRALEWARSCGLRLDLVCNGYGSDRQAAVSGSGSDDLLEVLRAGKDAVGWVNHTYSHLLLYDAGAAAVDEQIDLNLEWARRTGVELEPDALVTGAHSGLGDLSVTPPQSPNASLVAAIEARGIRFVGCDASRSYPTGGNGGEALAGELFRVGGAVAVPRHPLPLPYDAVSSDEALDRLRHHGGGDDASWESVVARESARVLSTMLSNDPRPHYCHQSNLIGAPGTAGEQTLLAGLVDAVCRRYRGAVAANTPILQPTMSESGRLLERDIAWRSAVEDGSLRAFTDGAQVRIENGADGELSAPLTGTTTGESYAGTRSGWLTVSPGTTVVPGDHGLTGTRRR